MKLDPLHFQKQIYFREKKKNCRQKRSYLFRTIFVVMFMDSVSILPDFIFCQPYYRWYHGFVKNVLSMIPTPHFSIPHCWSEFLDRLWEIGISRILYMGIWISSLGNETVGVWSKWLNAVLLRYRIDCVCKTEQIRYMWYITSTLVLQCPMLC